MVSHVDVHHADCTYSEENYVQEVNMKLDIYLADLFVLYQKLHVIHWNITGRQFKAFHAFTEDLYDEVHAKFDTVAEIYRMKEKFPPSKIKDYLDKSTLKETPANRAFGIDEATEIIIGDLEAMRELALEVRKEHEKDDDFVVVNEIEDHVADYDKHLWFMRAMLAKENK